MLADGYINLNYTKFEISLKDKEHIEKFKKFLNSDHKISERVVKSNGAIVYRISIQSKKIGENLKNLGLENNKTYKEIHFENFNIPKENIRHLVRGFFEGDGTIELNKNKEKIRAISFASYDIESLDNLNKLITKDFDTPLSINNSFKCHCPTGNLYGENSRNFLDWLYTNSTIYLDRKYQRYKKCR